MAIEGVQRHAAEYRIPQCRHLLQLIASGRLAARPIPGSPFVDNQLYPVLGIFLSHDLPVAIDKPLHAVPLTHELIPIRIIKLESIALALNPILRLPAAQVPGVMVEGPPIDGAKLPSSLASDFLEETSSPSPVIYVRTSADERQLLSEARYPGRAASARKRRSRSAAGAFAAI